MRTGVIYMIISPTGKMYIGQTLRYKQRVSSYRALRCKDQPKIYNSLLKYGFEAHTMSIICECSQENLDKKEIELIAFYNTLNEGLNCTEGGKSYVPSLETRKKIALKSGSRRHTQETKTKISLSKKGHNYCLGKTHTNSTIQKMKLSHIGKHDNLKKSVECIDKEGTIYKFNSLTEGAVFVGRNHKSVTNLCAAINGKLKTAFGYRWRYQTT